MRIAIFFLIPCCQDKLASSAIFDSEVRILREITAAVRGSESIQAFTDIGKGSKTNVIRGDHLQPQSVERGEGLPTPLVTPSYTSSTDPELPDCERRVQGDHGRNQDCTYQHVLLARKQIIRLVFFPKQCSLELHFEESRSLLTGRS